MSIGRRQVIQNLGASALVPFLPRFHPSIPPQEGEWKPRFFHGSEVDTVAAVAERIIPETDTPGARNALVHQYIDFVLSKTEPSAGERFREGLRGLDRKCGEAFGKPFVELEAAGQDELLTRISKDDPFFNDVKRLTVDGYYRSEAGMKQELGFEGNTFVTEFEGCTHPEHHAWNVGRRGERSEPGREEAAAPEAQGRGNPAVLPERGARGASRAKSEASINE